MKSDHERMAYAFKRATKAIAVTASTTSVAFAANGFSPIIPIRSFGIYAAIIVLVNYMMVVMIMPSVQMIYERKFKDKCGCCDRFGDSVKRWFKQRFSCGVCCIKKKSQSHTSDEGNEHDDTIIDLEKEKEATMPGNRTELDILK